MACVFVGVDQAGRGNTATSALLTQAASTATATAPRGSVSATPTGEASSVTKVRDLPLLVKSVGQLLMWTA